MKNALKNFLLWQKKRNKLPVNDDPQADWGQMQSLLDEHLPVVKKPGGFKGFRTLPAILITFSAAAMIYVAGNIQSLHQRNRAVKHHFHNASTIQPGARLADSADPRKTQTDTGNLLPGGKNLLPGSKSAAVDNGSTSSATIKRSLSSSASSSATGTTKNTNALAAANKPGQGVNGATRQSNLSSTAQQNARQLKAPISNNKTGFSRGRYAQYHSGATGAGYGNGNRGNGNNVNGHHGNGNYGKRADQNKPGGSVVNNYHADQAPVTVRAGNNRGQDGPLSLALYPAPKIVLSLSKIQPLSLPMLSSRLSLTHPQAGSSQKGGKKSKPDKPQNTRPSNIDWGILIGVNTSGSFTPKSQNANFYGSASIDPWFGLFASYKINDNWAIAPQVRFFSPQTVVTSYTHANQSQVDSGQSLTITSSRKMYTISVPIYLAYNTGNGLRLKAGPVISFPVKQINTGSVLLPYSIRTDTNYYKNISTILNATQYQQNINFGFSAGASYQYKRFIFESTYLKSLSGYGVSSGLGTYKSYSGTFQFTIGFQLDKVKP